jgi:hypothetical protein
MGFIKNHKIISALGGLIVLIVVIAIAANAGSSKKQQRGTTRQHGSSGQVGMSGSRQHLGPERERRER